jgi:hypothetical protein
MLPFQPLRASGPEAILGSLVLQGVRVMKLALAQICPGRLGEEITENSIKARGLLKKQKPFTEIRFQTPFAQLSAKTDFTEAKNVLH